MNETIVFVDAGYLSYISKYFGKGKPLKYKIEKFSVNLAKQKNLACEKIYFYIAPPFQSPNPTKEENKRKANYDKFIAKLKNANPEIKLPTAELAGYQEINLIHCSKKRRYQNSGGWRATSW